jgi:hypothetical protein
MVAGVKIVATPDGVKVEGEGYVGPSCSLDVAKVLAALGLSPDGAHPKPEFYLNNTTSKEQQASQG